MQLRKDPIDRIVSGLMLHIMIIHVWRRIELLRNIYLETLRNKINIFIFVTSLRWNMYHHKNIGIHTLQVFQKNWTIFLLKNCFYCPTPILMLINVIVGGVWRLAGVNTTCWCVLRWWVINYNLTYLIAGVKRLTATNRHF